MTPETARNILAFLERADLKGSEVPAYVTAVNALQGIVNPVPEPDDDKEGGA